MVTYDFEFYTQTAVHEGTDLMETTVFQEAKEIKDQLEEMNQSIDTLASSSAAKQSSRDEFLKTLLPRPLLSEPRVTQLLSPLLRGHHVLDALTLALY